MTRNWVRGKQNDKYDLLISGNVVNLSWKVLQPTKDGPLNQAALQIIRDAAEDGPVRLRVLGGTNSPDWVLEENDAFLYVEDQQDKTYLCPRWWYDSYIAAWEQLQLRLYNEVHEYVAEVCQTGGGTRYGEPFIRGPWSNKAVYNEMGFDLSVDEPALDRFVEIMQRVWSDKPLIVSVFPYQYMLNERPQNDKQARIEDTFRLIDKWGPDMIGTHNLRAEPGSDLVVYERMAATGIPLYFQTAEPARFVDWRGGLAVGLEYGAYNVELPHHFPTFDYVDLADFAYRYQS